ncbi:hypothetical protein RND71_001563 [Anisodus tanguticus]|uniref:NAD-dependent epimerase/dehydratase domain-containing protein n=1 Tax=Anisodus tanguticus TaxID=243964 RepID=A0AAE1T2Y4_9SOLA|nr:hypothetical protein RND71_001563 [Anisodus tanguticus]
MAHEVIYQQWYNLSKTLAEEAAWKFAKENGIDLVTLHPGLVIGPFLQPTLNFSPEAILNFITQGFGQQFIGTERIGTLNSLTPSMTTCCNPRS